MIDAKCSCCGSDIEEKAALLISPPLPLPKQINTGGADVVHKAHLCGVCYSVVKATITELQKSYYEAKTDESEPESS